MCFMRHDMSASLSVSVCLSVSVSLSVCLSVSLSLSQDMLNMFVIRCCFGSAFVLFSLFVDGSTGSSKDWLYLKVEDVFIFFRKNNQIFFWVWHQNNNNNVFVIFEIKYSISAAFTAECKPGSVPTVASHCYFFCSPTRRVYFLWKIQNIKRFVDSAEKNSLRVFRWKKCLTTIARQSKTEADIYIYIYIF